MLPSAVILLPILFMLLPATKTRLPPDVMLLCSIRLERIRLALEFKILVSELEIPVLFKVVLVKSVAFWVLLKPEL